MKNFSFSVKSLRQLRFDARYAFCAFLLLILVMEGLVIRDALKIVLQLEGQAAPQAPRGGVRINFEDYDANLKRLENGKNYQPSGGTSRNPFSASSPEPAAQPPTSGGVGPSGVLEAP